MKIEIYYVIINHNGYLRMMQQTGLLMHGLSDLKRHQHQNLNGVAWRKHLLKVEGTSKACSLAYIELHQSQMMFQEV